MSSQNLKFLRLELIEPLDRLMAFKAWTLLAGSAGMMKLARSSWFRARTWFIVLRSICSISMNAAKCEILPASFCDSVILSSGARAAFWTASAVLSPAGVMSRNFSQNEVISFFDSSLRGVLL